jgi:hypothetical protein
MPVHLLEVFHDVFVTGSLRRSGFAVGPGEPARPSPELFETVIGPLLDAMRFRVPIQARFRCRVHRGLVERMTLSAGDLERHAETIFTGAPVQEAVVFDAPFHEGFERLLRCPRLSRLRKLVIEGALSAEAQAALVQTHHLRGLTSLDLTNVFLATEIGETLGQMKNLPSLRDLSLSGQPLGDDGVRALVQNPAWESLERLNLDRTGLTDAGVQALAGAVHLKRVRWLSLAHNRLTRLGVHALSHSPHLPELRELDLSFCSLGGSIIGGLDRWTARVFGLRAPSAWVRDLLASPLAGRLKRLRLAGIDLSRVDRDLLVQRFGPCR